MIHYNSAINGTDFNDNYQCPGKTNAGHNYLRYQKSRSSLILGIVVVNKISKFFIKI